MAICIIFTLLWYGLQSLNIYLWL